MVKKHPRDGYGVRIHVSAFYWVRLRGNMTLLADKPGEPGRERPYLSRAASMVVRWANQRALERKHNQMKRPLTPARAVRMAAAHDVGDQRLERRVYVTPEAWVTGAGLPNAVSIMPARAMSREADVLAPLQQAAISAGVVTAAVWASGASWKYFIGLPWLSYVELLIPASLIGLGVGLFVWFGVLKKNRIGMWAFETAVNMDLDGDDEIGEPGIRPRSVPVNSIAGTQQVPMNEKQDGPKRSEWTRAAVALLISQGRVSRRGIRDNTDGLSQTVAQEISRLLHETGRATDGRLNKAGYDYLLTFLPEHLSPSLPYPAE